MIKTAMGSTVTTREMYEKDSVRRYVPDQHITAPWWASPAEEWWKLAAENPYWMGGFYLNRFRLSWRTQAIQLAEYTSHFGVMDVSGSPKNIGYYYQS